MSTRRVSLAQLSARGYAASGALVTAHSVHRSLGSGFALLIAVWFASGAMMTFVDYPGYSDRERLAHAPRLARGLVLTLPNELRAWLEHGGLRTGDRLRLAQLEGQPTWLFTDRDRRRALRALPASSVPLLDARRARSEVERQFGPCRGTAIALDEPDQWTVGRSEPGSYPLWRLACDDARGNEIYVSARSGEIVQHSSRAERIGAWLGPIPHWIYPAILRRNSALWSNTVLGLASAGLLVSLSGLIAGWHAWYVARKQRAAGQVPALRQAYLQWHQRLGLAFGALASTWLFSGALSLQPFDWSGTGPSTEQLAALHGGFDGAASALPLTAALVSCQSVLPVVELEIATLGQRALMICSSASAESRIVDLTDANLTPRMRLAEPVLNAAAQTSARGARFQLQLKNAPDAYYYPTHRAPVVALPFAVIQLSDRERSALYIDPARAERLLSLTTRRRVERWLFSGLHSWDLPGFYELRGLWQTLMLAAMLTGFALASLGFTMFLRRSRRQRVSSQTVERIVVAEIDR